VRLRPPASASRATALGPVEQLSLIVASEVESRAA
jgi:hypothetical protein